MNDMDHYTGALLEHMDRKFDMILEMLAPIPQIQKDIADIKDRLGSVETDIKVVAR